MRNIYVLGKIDYNKSGRRNCEATFEWDLRDGKFTMSANVWNPRHTDIYAGGQCCDMVAAYFPNDKRAQRMLAIWEQWHLNHMKAGTPAQEAHLKGLKYEYGKENHFDWAKRKLAEAGLQPDNGYNYGSAWLKQEIPADVIAEIESWSD